MNRKKLLYAFLKEIEEGNGDISHSDFELTEEQFHEISSLATNEGLVTSVQWYDDQPHFHLARISLKGLDFLQENSLVGKAYKGLKEITTFLK